MQDDLAVSKISVLAGVDSKNFCHNISVLSAAGRYGVSVLVVPEC